MAKPKKLKVFRTPIGFHDAYVAAPSQKAALEAWGVDTNLFAAGAAEQVTEPDLMEELLAKPGVVFKRLRGSEAEQIAALGQTEAKRGRTTAKRAQPEASKKKAARPSKAALEQAEAALSEAEKRQRKEVDAIERELRAIGRRRSELLRRHERERDELAETAGRERKKYEQALREWKKS